MFQTTVSILVGVATLLLILSLSTSHWHSVQYDKDGYVHSYSGLWHQMLSVRGYSNVSEKECASKTMDDCEKDPNRSCVYRNGKCVTSQSFCAKQSKANCKPVCKTSPFTGDCVHEYDTEFDVSVPYSGYNKDDDKDKRGFVEAARVLGILSWCGNPLCRGAHGDIRHEAKGLLPVE